MVSITAGLNKATPENSTPRQSGSSPASSSMSRQHWLSAVHTRPNRSKYRQTEWQTDQISTQQLGTQHQKGWQPARPRQRLNKCLSASHGLGRPQSDVVLMLDGLNFCLQCKYELKTVTKTQKGLDMGRRDRTDRREGGFN